MATAPERHFTYLRVGVGLRALGAITAVLELWPCGHASPKHQHGGCAGSVRVVSGRLDVEIYLYDQDAAPLTSTRLEAPQTTWMDRQNFFCHSVSSPPDNDGLAISLHVYKSCTDEFAFDSAGTVVRANPANDFFWNFDLPPDDLRVSEDDVPDFLEAIRLDVTHAVAAMLRDPPSAVGRLLARAKERIESAADQVAVFWALYGLATDDAARRADIRDSRGLHAVVVAIHPPDQSHRPGRRHRPPLRLCRRMRRQRHDAQQRRRRPPRAPPSRLTTTPASNPRPPQRPHRRRRRRLVARDVLSLRCHSVASGRASSARLYVHSSRRRRVQPL
mmetsp:Transcript_414/g.1171  ORF Transcript_414/g.1171 Transcript_414/m.1171 type:complete len:332 (-) Transcript_414:61-1056(-)